MNKTTSTSSNITPGNIVTTPDPCLRARSTKIKDFNDPSLKQLITDMIDASLLWEKSHPHELSAAMAAPQLGVNRRVIIIRDNLENKEDDTFTALVNPEVIKAEGKPASDYEGCLSVPFIYGLVPRPTKVKIKAHLPDGREVRIKAEDTLARTLLHEIDHLNGILFIDHIKDTPAAFFTMNEKGDLVPVKDYENDIKNNISLWGD